MLKLNSLVFNYTGMLFALTCGFAVILGIIKSAGSQQSECEGRPVLVRLTEWYSQG